MQRRSINRLNSLLSLSCKKYKVDVCVDLSVNSGFGHYSRISEFLKKFGVKADRWFHYPSDMHIHTQKKNGQKILFLDSFIMNSKKVIALTHIYRFIILLNDGPIRPHHSRILKLNWEPDRHLQKRFHLRRNCFSSFLLFPYINKNIDKKNNSLFCYFSNDGSDIINRVMNQLDLEQFQEINIVGTLAKELSFPNTVAHKSISEEYFDYLLNVSETILVPGGNTFYKALKLQKKILVYVNGNKYLSWERQVAHSRGIRILDGRNL